MVGTRTIIPAWSCAGLGQVHAWGRGCVGQPSSFGPLDVAASSLVRAGMGEPALPYCTRSVTWLVTWLVAWSVHSFTLVRESWCARKVLEEVLKRFGLRRV